MKVINTLMILGAAALPCLNLAVIYVETEPNDSWDTGNVINGIQPGDRVQGHVHRDPAGSQYDDLDYWRIHVPNESAFGIYEYSLRYESWDTSRANRHEHITRLWDSRFANTPYGFGSSEGDVNNPYKLRFYSFGTNGYLPYVIRDRVQGIAGSDYDLVWERNAIAPFSIGAIQEGAMSLRFTRRGTAGSPFTSVAFFDANGNYVQGTGHYQDINSYTMSLQLTSGTYYVAVSGFLYGSDPFVFPQVFENSQFMTGYSSASGGLSWSHALTLTSGLTSLPINYEASLVPKGVPGMAFGRLTVVPEPASVLTLGATLLGFARSVRKGRRA